VTLADKAGRNRLVDSLALATTVGGALLVAREAGLGVSWWAAPFLVAVILTMRMGCLAVHEVGHLLAGSLAGWQWETLKLGPLLVWREDGSTRVTFCSRERVKAAGQVRFASPASVLDTEPRRIAMLAGGPLASAGLAWGAWLLWRTLDAPLAEVVAGVVALYSTVVFVTTVLPFESAGNLSDGGAILLELRRRSAGRERHAPEVEL
jgi:hypothetical protein